MPGRALHIVVRIVLADPILSVSVASGSSANGKRQGARRARRAERQTMMKRTIGPAQRPQVRQAFWADANWRSQPAAAGPVRRELLAWPGPSPRVDALTAELRDRIAKAARVPLIVALLSKR
jgi:hypothetical protein